MNCEYIAHSFDPKVAEVYGIPAAIIFQYIARRSDDSPDRWVRLTLNDICKQYPYLGRDQCWRGLHRLINATRKSPPIIFRKPTPNRRAFLYAPACAKHKCDHPHSFDIQLAERLGLVPAIIYYNVGFWIKQNWINNAEEAYAILDPNKFDGNDQEMQAFAYRNTRESAAHYCAIDKWLKRHPYISERSAQRGFACLLEDGQLSRTCAGDRTAIWHLPSKILDKFEVMFLEIKDLEDLGAKTKRWVPKPNAECQNQTMGAKTKRQMPVSGSADEGSASVKETLYETIVTRSARQKPLEDDSNAFRLPVADAPDVAGTALNGASRGPTVETRSYERDILRKIAYLNRPNLPLVKKKVTDHLGVPVKRPYHMKPHPENPNDLNVMEDMTPEQLDAYVRGS